MTRDGRTVSTANQYRGIHTVLYCTELRDSEMGIDQVTGIKSRNRVPLSQNRVPFYKFYTNFITFYNILYL